MRIALATLSIAFSARAATLTGTVMDQTGAYVPHIAVVLDSGTSRYQVQTDDAGVYKFSGLRPEEYTLVISARGFKLRTIRSIRIVDAEDKQIPDVPLDVEICGGLFRDLSLLLPGNYFGRLGGSVVPAQAEVEVTLVCRTFTACRSTKTDSNGHFSFEMLSAGVYGLNFRHDGFYPVNATGYTYTVNAGWESVYSPAVLEACPNGNCDPKLRAPKQPSVCE
jgi:hypothetical protein